MKQIDTLRILLLATLLLAAGCTDETGEPTPAAIPVEVNFALPGIGSPAPASRAAMAANTTVRIIPYNVTRARYETVATYYVDASGKLAPCTVNADGSFAAVSATKMKLMMGDNYTFYTATPALPIKSGTDYTMTVSNGMDFASSLTNNITVTPANAASLPLNQLSRYAAQINVVVKSTDVLAKNLKPVAPGMKLSNLPPNMDRTLDGTATTGSDGTQTLASAVGNATQTDVRTITYAPVCILPKAGTTPLVVSATVAITVGTTTKTVTYTASLPTAANGSQFEAGKSYTVTLIVTPDNPVVVPTVEVTEWVSGGSIATYPCVKANEAGKMSVIVSRDVFGEAASMKFHEPWFQTPDHTETMTNGYQMGETVAASFEVAESDYGYYPWNGTNWGCPAPYRRPTIRELELIAQMYGSGALSGVNSLSEANWYHSASLSSSANNASCAIKYYSSGSNRTTVSVGNQARMRCVKDVLTSDTYPYVFNGRFIISKDDGGSSGAALHENWTQTPDHKDTDPANSVSACFEVAENDYGYYPWNGTNWGCTAPYRRPTFKELELIARMCESGALSGVNSLLEANWYHSATLSSTVSNASCAIKYSRSGSNRTTVPVGNQAHMRCVKDF